MPFYLKRGEVPAKRHIAFYKPGGEAQKEIYYEQLVGNKGFTGIASLLYHIHRPTEILDYKVLKETRWEAEENDELRMRHLRSSLVPEGGSLVMDRTPLMFNNDIGILFSKPTVQDEHFYRNAQGDEVIYVSDGSGTLESQYGNLPYRRGDYLVIPRGILYRLKMNSEKHNLLIMESTGEIRTPKRYRNEHGQMVEGAPFSERDIRVPEELVTVDETGDFPIIVKQYDKLVQYTMKHHPCDVVGWDGYYYPWAFNIEDFEPLVGRIHLPPPVHQTFQGDGFVVCSFCPRPFDFHERSVPAPYHHSNVMSDEVLYYASTEFMSRKGVEYGSLTLHPDGLVHGPQPGKTEESIGAKATDEYAVMIDTFRQLKVAKAALPTEDTDYYRSWVE